ncbi:MAG TPA: Rrf2 family transcriptional regulator [Acidimicrobiia bacterium]|nr:Rrf2 family transcriptional regulator [Acidimicrobiia bacterium]
MRLSEGVEWALHSCAVLALLGPDHTLPATRLAEFHGVPAAYLAKHLQQLSRAGVVESMAGRRGGYRLARPPAEIRLLDVVEAVEGSERAFRCAEIRRRGPSAVSDDQYSPVCGIARAMWRAEAAWRAELARQTLADVVGVMGREVSPEAVAKAAAWFQEVVR